MFRRSMKSTIIKQRQTKGNKSFFLVMEFVPVSTLAKIAHRVKKKYFRFRYSPSLVKSNIRNRAIPFVACIRVYFKATPEIIFATTFSRTRKMGNLRTRVTQTSSDHDVTNPKKEARRWMIITPI